MTCLQNKLRYGLYIIAIPNSGTTTLAGVIIKLFVGKWFMSLVTRNEPFVIDGSKSNFNELTGKGKLFTRHVPRSFAVNQF